MAHERFAILTDENVALAVSEQLNAKGIEAERLINVLAEGTPDPDVLEFAHKNGYALLTHDEAITKHTSDRNKSGKEHAGVFIAPNRL